MPAIHPPPPAGVAPAPPAPGWPLLRLGFRPFYLLAALASVVLMPLWALIFMGRLQLASGMPGLYWHGHEMLFGVVAAVIVGFLFTAGKSWTGLQTPRGAALGGFVLLWVAARLASVLAPYAVFFALDVVFLPLVAVVFTRLLLKSRNHRNLGIAAVLGLMAVANLVFHLGVAGAIDLSPQKALFAGMALVLVIEVVIAGRVIPMFTRNAIPGLTTSVPAWRERLVMVSTVLGLALWLLGFAVLSAAVLIVATALHVWRLCTWKPWATRGRPILWSLHASYLWIPVGLGLLAVAQWQGQSESPAMHALAIGASGGLILAMMTRSSRGHTGRPLEVGAPEAWAYGLMLLAAVVRVGTPLLLPALYLPGLAIAGLCFAVSFLLYLWVYTGWLMRPRLDGRDG